MATHQPAPGVGNNQGEGDKAAARRYNEDQQRFVTSGAVKDAASKAPPRHAREATELQAAEQRGQDKSKGEDASGPGAVAKTVAKNPAQGRNKM